MGHTKLQLTWVSSAQRASSRRLFLVFISVWLGLAALPVALSSASLPEQLATKREKKKTFLVRPESHPEPRGFSRCSGPIRGPSRLAGD